MNDKMKECIVICHGKSEVSIMKFIKQVYRLPIKIVSEDGGKNSVQITSLLNFLNRRDFKNLAYFLRTFELDKLTKNTKIFTIMDTDDCNITQFNAYIDKSMFKNHHLENYIIPIYNKINLEDVIKRTKLNIYNNKADAVKIFPIRNSKNNINKKDSVQIVYDELKNDKGTNLDKLLLYCMENETKF